jgi:ABC-2 type transport system ATP-binding protein
VTLPEVPDPIVVARGLVRDFDLVHAVRGVDLEVRRGEMFGLIGPDGAGKTTTLRMIAGLLAPTAGTVTTCGFSPRAQRPQLARRVGYLAQRFSLYGDLTVDENLEFFAELQDVPERRARRDEMLELVRLTPFRRRLPDRLSGGMKQKLALACTLIHTPSLIILDEPTTGVDPVSRRDFWRLLAEIRRRGITILISTPYLDEAERLLAAMPGGHDLEAFGERLHFRLDPGRDAAAIARALHHAGIAVTDLRAVRAALEDVFLARIRASERAEDDALEGTALR